ncbi:MAG: hypothetical protein JKY65_19255 [Planctomycetes bacterium]|nr:hypothetical protein [Planctomycetota bacterium]
MGRAVLLLFGLACLGCSSGPPPAPPRPLVLALLPAPRLAALDLDAEPSGLAGGDFLLEVATQLSAEARLDLCLVPGPCLSVGLEDEALEEALVALADGLGQIAAPVYLGLTADDEPRAILLEALGEALQGHPGEASVWGKSVLGWRPVALSAGQTLAALESEARAEARRAKPPAGEDDEEESEDEEAARVEEQLPLLLVQGDAGYTGGDPRTRLRVVSGEVAEVVTVGKVVEIRLPALESGLYALVTLFPDRLELEWRSVEPERVEAPPPVSLPWPGAKRKP